MNARPDLDALTSKWQEILRLRDWNVAVSYVPGLRTQGACDCFADAKAARISIRDPRDGGQAFDVENALVQELLRLHIAPLAQATPAGRSAEGFAVGAIASALAAAKNPSVRAHLVSTLLDTPTRTARASRTAQKETTMKTANQVFLEEGDRRMGVDRSGPAGAVSRNPLNGALQISNLRPMSGTEVRAARASHFGAARHARAGQRAAMAPAKLEALRADFDWLADVSDAEIERLLAAAVGANSDSESEQEPANIVPARAVPTSAQRARGTHKQAPHLAALYSRLGLGGVR